MRGNNRKSIEKCRKKLPQFTTMNVIDGQAGLVIYSSLIFYSLTIDNILNIIVLLILAGISITMLTGQNGILNRAQEAKEKTEDAVLEEKIKLLTAETLINEYTGQEEEKTAQELQNELNNQGENVLVIQWDKYIIFDLNKNKEYRVMNDGSIEYWGETTLGQTLLNAKTANEDQVAQDGSTSNIIGIDNDGNTVNMLLWEYTLIDDSSLGRLETYGLNDKNGLDSSGESGRSAGYIGGYTEDGKIFGTVPAYISIDGGNLYISVTSMVHTFYDCDSLVISPEIPDTIIKMRTTFYHANNLTTAPSRIPDSVIDFGHTFLECEKLSTVPILGKRITDMRNAFKNTAITEFTVEIPSSVTIMNSTFMDCENLTKFTSKLPNNLVDMKYTFYNCINLENIAMIIPNTVTIMSRTFYNCYKLNGVIEINANLKFEELKSFEWCFWDAATEEGKSIIIKGSCSSEVLNKMIEQKGENSKIEIEN